MSCACVSRISHASIPSGLMSVMPQSARDRGSARGARSFTAWAHVSHVAKRSSPWAGSLSLELLRWAPRSGRQGDIFVENSSRDTPRAEMHSGLISKFRGAPGAAGADVRARTSIAGRDAGRRDHGFFYAASHGVPADQAADAGQGAGRAHDRRAATSPPDSNRRSRDSALSKAP
jgi:hypothetical protein